MCLLKFDYVTPRNGVPATVRISSDMSFGVSVRHPCVREFLCLKPFHA